VQRNKSSLFAKIENKEELYNELGDSLTILDSLRLRSMEIFILGRHKSDPFLKYKPTELNYDFEKDSVLLDIIPEWFFPYADLVNPLERNYNSYKDTTPNTIPRQGYFTRQTNYYYTWLYPGYDFNIFIFYDSPDDWSDVVFPKRSLHNVYSYDEKELIILPKPLFRQLMWEREDILQRFISYKNLVLYTFVSPFIRDPVKNKSILKKKTITLADLDSLGLNSKQKDLMKEYVR
jgi:hypothetical protein